MSKWREPLDNRRIVAQLTAVIVVTLLFPLGLGILLDRLLHTFPLLTLFTLMMGTTVATIWIARAIASEYQRLGGTKQ